jgi:ABC-type transporter Mla subunit MlaD
MSDTLKDGKFGGLLAHISDAVTATEEKVDQLLEQQGTLVAILTRMSEDLRAQSEMLAEILGAARGDPGPSPIEEALVALEKAVAANTDAVAGIADELAAMPADLAGAITAAIGGAPGAQQAEN